MDKPLISVVVPIYKVEEYLRKCLDSILNQTYNNLEIILVDDGSPDNCPAICDEYEQKDSRIKVIHKENGGLSDARNTGIKIAAGEYIGFVDSDDYIEPKMYEYLYCLVKKYNADISTCGYRKFGDVKETNIVSKKEMCIDSIEALKMLADDTILQNYAVNKLYIKSLFIDYDILYPNGKIMEDIATTYKIIEKSNKVVIGNKTFYNYLIRNTSITGEKTTSVYLNQIEHVRERYNYFKNNEELSFYYYKNLFYVVMRMYIKSTPETIEFIENNNLLEYILSIGKEKNYIKKLPKADKIRLFILKKNPKLYSFIMIMRRRTLDIIK